MATPAPSQAPADRNDAAAHGWKVFDAATPLLTYTYSFGPGEATALAVAGARGMIVASPPCRVHAEALDEINRYGPIRALVATNGFHHMGLVQWKTRFPDAEVFAPAQSIARVERRTGIRGVRPIGEAAELGGEDVEFTDMPHYKTGEALIRVRTGRGLVWYVTDVVFNLRELPAHPLARLAFRLSHSGPGLRFNNIASLFMMKDKRALKRWLASELDRAPPRWLIPAHGDVLDLGPRAERLLPLFALKK